MQANKSNNSPELASPPKWPGKLLEWLCREELLEEVQGDLQERYYLRVQKLGEKKARNLYIREVLAYMRPSIIKRGITTQPFNTHMIQNYFLIAYRNLLRFKAYTLLNIMGLAIGIACSILILLWVQNEMIYDKFHKNASSLYRITADAGEMRSAYTSPAIAPTIQARIPYVEKVLRLRSTENVVEVDGRQFEEKNGFFADSSFFDVFTFPLNQAAHVSLLQQPDEIILTKQLARKYFGQENVLGKTILLDGKHLFKIAGILDNIPATSHLKFDYLLPISFLAKTQPEIRENSWNAFLYYTYLQLSSKIEKKDLPEVERRITSLFEEHVPQAKGQIKFGVQPLTAIHLHSKLSNDVDGHGNIAYVRILSLVAAFILLLACINFMNLSTARSARRAKEVGLRKVIGARRDQLIGQFLGESLLLSFMALLAAIVILLLTQPFTQELIGFNVLTRLLDKETIISLLCITSLTGLLSGCYPAFYLSSLGLQSILKKGKTLTYSSGLRSSLVVIQFVIAIGLILGTVVVHSQLKFIQYKHLGFDKENLLCIPMKGKLWDNYQTLRSKLASSSITSRFTVISDLPTNLQSHGDVEWEGKNKQQIMLFNRTSVDENFLEVFGTQLLSGRNFLPATKSDTGKVIINETASSIMGLRPDNAIGKTIMSGTTRHTIIGVVKDFHFRPLHQPIEPLMLQHNTWGGNVIVKIKPGQFEQTLTTLEEMYQELNAGYEFSYGFIDQDLDKLYRTERRMASIFTGFAILSILISCLGLFGLTAYVAEQRTKEIGIRKVLGASVFNIVVHLANDFLKLILFGFVIGAPLAAYFMQRWLEDFAYRIELTLWMFALAIGLTLLVALLTVSFQSIKAALANPIKSLRNE